VAARLVTVPLAFLMALVVRAAAFPERPILPLIVFTGFADMGANLAIVIAVQRGPLGINAVLSSLYPAFTVVAALVILSERPNTAQRAGIALALLAALILAL